MFSFLPFLPENSDSSYAERIELVKYQEKHMIIILLQLSEKLWRYIIISELRNDIFFAFF